ncbi:MULTISPECIES: GNAT family N-acetyltransferase [unclassified Mucilaginibacter]|uniref:GNAT family N-acetyltransferase n=1 Tax=unclassified Mucilaginibacter TaxID=2617802 RepID=UPI002AC97D65|nr:MULTISPECIES: GNAT family N-acetyltransferase [unclassified Mucilaginibacter]MEB0261438.1 GNAT family N-acetyltransferase [Mucilaginibacter sp. 10I4]MEB0276976.1 GNAT family N-acetyltransferase [Mucilaginibacter sp. 10B2]MEB0301501.1 GNAT family N-acetyltransferase [Mucilaginibacter sp. 5C4]WPX25076.1 GNAT family N-acetyltransferase [Mucilaginibacter sp. 5C4]
MPKRFDWTPAAYSTMENITTRPATVADMDTLLQFEQGVISAERPFDPTLKEGHINYYDLNELITAPHIQLVIAELNGEIIGSGYARIETSKIYLQHPQHAYLGFMYVLPQHRGKGINKLVINALKEWSVQQGITEFRLEVYFGNVPAIKAYEKVGFNSHMIEMRMGL